MNRFLILQAIFVAVTLPLFGQQAKKTTILYNVTPLEVDLAPDGTIVNIHGRADEYFKGYQLVKNKDVDNLEAKVGNDFYQPKQKYTVSTDVLNLDFKDNLALLTRNSIAAIDEAAIRLLAKPDLKLLITPYKSQLSSDEKILLTNRIKTVLMYFEIKGISKSNIAFNDTAQTTKDGQIILTYINN